MIKPVEKKLELTEKIIRKIGPAILFIINWGIEKCRGGNFRVKVRTRNKEPATQNIMLNIIERGKKID